MNVNQIETTTNTVEDFQLVCRLCLSLESLEDVFEYEDLHLLISNTLTVVISEDDTMSRKICLDCRSKLAEFRDFKEKCLEIQETLQCAFYPSFDEHAFIIEDQDIKLLDLAEQLEMEDVDQNVQLKKSEDTVKLEPIPSMKIFRKQSPKRRSCTKREKVFRVQKIVMTKSGRKRYIYDLKESYKNQLLDCEICGKKVAKIRMEGHKNMHTGSRPFKCERGCDADFHCQQLRLHHYRNVHDGELHECDVCQKLYRSKRSLSYHKKDVHSAKTVICSVCSQAFVSNARLNQHMKFHNGEKNHPCSECAFSFYSNHDLKKHMKTHGK